MSNIKRGELGLVASHAYTGPSSTKFSYSFDAKFMMNDYSEGTVVKMVQAKLYKAKDYYSSAVDVNLASATAKVDHINVLEVEVMNYKLDLVKKGGNTILSDYYPDGFKRHACKLESVAMQIKVRSSSSSLCIIVCNSVHMLYCQCYFYNVDTNVGYIVKLFDMVKPNDHPSFDRQGKTSLWIDDVQWSPNELFCIMALRSRDLAIITRLGTLVKFVVHPSNDILSSMRFNTEKFQKEPKRFNEMVCSRDAQIVDKTHDEEHVKLMFEDDRVLVRDNRVFFVYYYIQHEDILPMLNWCDRSELGFNFLRLCLSHEASCTLPENLERIPVLMNSKLPQFEFEKNAENDEIDDDHPIIVTPAEIKPFEITKSQLSNDSFNQDFNLDPEVLLSNFNKFLMSLRWTKSHPKNFKEWFMSIVDDCFYFCLKMNEPIYAYHLLKISKSFMQHFLYKLEPTDKAMLLHSDRDNEIFNPENHTLKECLSVLSKREGFSESNYKCYNIDTIFEYVEWRLKDFTSSDIHSEGNKFLAFHKNYALLVYYGLIQFRNYQANNFNILFLAFSCNILKRHFTPLGAKHISRIVDLVYRNYDLKEKSDECEMFLGKSGKNRLEGKDDLADNYKLAAKDTMFTEVLSVDNYENFMVTSLEFLAGNYEKVLTNLSYIEENGDIARCVSLIHQNRMNDAFLVINHLAEKAESSQLKMETHDFALATCINLVTTSLSKSHGSVDLKGTTCMGFSDALNVYLLCLKFQITDNSYLFEHTPFEHIGTTNVITQKMNLGPKILTKFLNQNSREMAIILTFYIHRLDRAKMMMFDYALNENLEKTYFDFLVASSVSKSIYKQMSLIDPEDVPAYDEFHIRNEYKLKLSSLFALIKKNLYSIIDQNLKKVFVTIYSNPDQDASMYTTIMIKLLDIIPKDLRVSVREGVIFDSIKVIKALSRKICKDSPSDTSFDVKLNNNNFMHLNMLNDIFKACVSHDDSEYDTIKELKNLYGKSQLLILITSFETILQCMVEEFSSRYQYNFVLHTDSISSESDIEHIIQLRKDPYNEENDISELLNSKAEKNQYEQINELYTKQVLRALRVLYFIVLKSKELRLTNLMEDCARTSPEYKEHRFNLFHVVMQLTSFDDMNNYSNKMKSAFEILIDVIDEADPDQNASQLYKALEILKNYYRSDIMHRRSKKIQQNLTNAIKESNMAEHIKASMLSVLEKNCCGTLDSVDAARRFKFLLREREFIDYLSRVQLSMDNFALANENGLNSNCKHALKAIKNTKLRFLQICREMHRTLSIDFDHSYVFEKGKSWIRVPNIFNLTNRLLERVESPRVKIDVIQQSSHEIEMDKYDDFIQSDILPAEEAKVSMRKTVHIELIDMDIDDFQSNLPSKRSKKSGNSDKLNASGSDTSVVEATKTNQSKEVNQFDVEDRTNRFLIKNFDLAQKFMKNRQCGREDTPTRKGLGKKDKAVLSKINTKFDLSNRTSNAWEEEDVLAAGATIEQVEPFDKPKISKIEKIKTDLKQVKSNLKVVRVTSARRSKKSKRVSKKKVTSKKNPFKLTRNKQELTESNSGSLNKKNMPPLPVPKQKSVPQSAVSAPLTDIETQDSVKLIQKLYKKWRVKACFKLWRENVLTLEPASAPLEQSDTFRNSSHKKKVSEYSKKPFSLLIVKSANKMAKEEVKSKRLVEPGREIQEDNYSHNRAVLQRVKEALNEQKQTSQTKGFKVIQLSSDGNSFITRTGSRKTKSSHKVLLKPMPSDSKETQNKERIHKYQEMANMMSKGNEGKSGHTQE